MRSIGEIPASDRVEQKHAYDGKEKSEEPKQSAQIAGAQIEMPERRKDKGGQNQRWYLICVVHGKPDISTSTCRRKNALPAGGSLSGSGPGCFPHDCRGTRRGRLCV